MLLGEDPGGVGGRLVVGEGRLVVEGLGRIREAVARAGEAVGLPGVVPRLEGGEVLGVSGDGISNIRSPAKDLDRHVVARRRWGCIQRTPA